VNKFAFPLLLACTLVLAGWRVMSEAPAVSAQAHGNLVLEPCAGTGREPVDGGQCARLELGTGATQGQGRRMHLAVALTPATQGEAAAEPALSFAAQFKVTRLFQLSVSNVFFTD